METHHDYIEREAAEEIRDEAARLKERVLPAGPRDFRQILIEAREVCDSELEVPGFLAQSIVGLETKLQALRESMASRRLS